MNRDRLKLGIALVAAFFITIGLNKTIFLFNSPQTNRSLIASFIKAILTRPKPTPNPLVFATLPFLPVTMMQPFPLLSPSPSPARISFVPTVKPNILPSPTPVPTKLVPTSLPTQKPTSCPVTSNETYNSITAERGSGDMPLSGDPVNSPEINLRLRGFGPVNEGANLISRNGNNYGLDDQMPPQISSLFGGVLPQIVKTYVVYEWDFQNSKSLAPQQATPNYKVHLVGLQTSPGQKLVGLKAARKIDPAGDVFMVLYATNTDITFTHSPSDSLLGGYLFYFADLCVDPNLLATYQSDNIGGRGQLPVIAQGQVFGYGTGSDVKVGIRDTMSFVDPRYKEDWWSYGQ